MKSLILQKLSHLICHHPKKIAVLSLGFALISAFYAFFHLKLDGNQDNLISPKLEYHQRYQSYLAEFGDAEYVYVVFEVPPGKPNRAKKALLTLVETLKNNSHYFQEINYQLDLGTLKSRALLSLPPKDFLQVTKRLKEWIPSINQISRSETLSSLFDFFAEKLAQPSSTLSQHEEELTHGLGLVQSILKGLLKPEKLAALPSDSFIRPLFGENLYYDADGFLFSPDGKFLFLELMPVKNYQTSRVIEKPLAFLRKQTLKIKKEFPDILVGVTGRPVLQADEIESTGNDSLWASLASLVAVGLLYFFYLRSLKNACLILLALTASISWSAGLTAFTVGHLNLITLVFAIILIGIGVDYGMHFLLRYLEEKNKGLAIEKALLNAMQTSSGGIITGALITSASFFSALFTDFLGLQELGYIAGMGILFCLVSQIVTLPALLVLADSKTRVVAISLPPRLTFFDTMIQRQKFLLSGILFLTLVFIPYLANMRFENNLLALQDPKLESVFFEKKIIQDKNTSTWFAASITPNLSRLKQLEHEHRSLQTVKGVESILSLFPVDEESRRQLLLQLKEKIIFPSFNALKEPDFFQLNLALEKISSQLEKLENLAFQGGYAKAVTELDEMIEEIHRIQEQFSHSGAQNKNRVAQAQTLLFARIQEALRELSNQLSPPEISVSQLPPALKKRYISQNGNHILYIYPKDNIWEPQNMERFIREIRQVDPLVTGAPLGVYESAHRMKKGFYLVGIVTLVLAFVILYLDFRSLKDTLISVLPLLLGMLWLLMGMGIFKISLNLANFFALPILMGLGIDSGVHLVHRFRETKNSEDLLHRTGPAIILSTLTTMIGFGALSFVRHKGLASFGQIMTIGSLTCLVAALVIVPVLLQWGLRYSVTSKKL